MKRRTFLKTSGALIVTMSASKFAGPIELLAQASGPYPDPDFHQLDSWIVIHENNTATFSVGKTDCGQGTGTAFRQMMADELDIDYDKTTCVMGSTDVTVDQGGSGGSDAIQTDGWPMRRVAAEARRVLLEMAASKFSVPVEALTVSSAVISVKADPAKRVSYGELIGGKKFHVALTGSNIDATTGVAKVKPVQDLKIVGQSPKRYDIPPKVDGTQQWAVDVKLPGMVHARNVKPPVAGAALVSIDESSVRNLPGFVRVVSKGNYAVSWGNTQWGQEDITVQGRTVRWLPSAFGQNGRLSFASVTDGLSATVFMAEVRQGQDYDIRGAVATVTPGGGGFMSRFGPNRFVDFYGSGITVDLLGYPWWLIRCFGVVVPAASSRG